ncbi:NYN domain-containing protein [Corynebacterium sp. HMSC08F01]|uniref:NYN domain-containing protein n=1 Tax=Corynebacterium sp. HMSC08F01 TaxID=1581139 RepID=UPI0008A11E15|nr:NYN domain-containing protein [Corynebacterium sp. HMSC08F01]OFT27560.1 NYN domain-containing protein [Corynebacterium sp. HMSC08F01]
MLERTLVFVDTSYLLASFYNSWEIGARAQLEIDLPEVVNALGNMITDQLHQPIHRQLWYDGIPDSGPHRYQRALRTCDGVQLRTGQLIEWGERRTQKGVDTRLVADLVVNGLSEKFTDFVLVSGDADMIPGVEEVTRTGTRVHLYGFGWDSMSSALRHACDSTTILDPREDFSNAMRLQVLEGPLPPTIRERPLNDAAPLDEADGPTSVPGLGPEPLSAECANAEAEKQEEKTGAGDGSGAGADAGADASQGSAESSAEGSKTSEAETTEAKPAAPASSAAPAAPKPSDIVGAPVAQQRTHEPDEPELDEPSEAQVEANNESNKPGNKQVSSEQRPAATPAPTPAAKTSPSDTDSSADSTKAEDSAPQQGPKPAPKPSMMAPRRKLRSRYVPLPEEVWTSAGFQTPYDVGQQYASWWFENAATMEQRDSAHLLSGGGLPPEIDRPLLQFACETLHEYTLTETQRVNLRDGFHSGIRGVLINIRRS